MGEIKSTLELVMSRTRHLNSSAEEKQRQRQEEGRKRLAGLMQRYEDGLLSPERLLTAIDELEAAYGIPGRPELARTLIRRIDPDQGPAPWSMVAADLPGLDPVLWGQAFKRYREDQDRLQQRCTDEDLRQLAAEGFSGSAVAPGPATGPERQAALEALREAFRRRLAEALPAAGGAGERPE